MCSLCAGPRGYATVCAHSADSDATIELDYWLAMHALSFASSALSGKEYIL